MLTYCQKFLVKFFISIIVTVSFVKTACLPLKECHSDCVAMSLRAKRSNLIVFASSGERLPRSPLVTSQWQKWLLWHSLNDTMMAIKMFPMPYLPAGRKKLSYQIPLPKRTFHRTFDTIVLRRRIRLRWKSAGSIILRLNRRTYNVYRFCPCGLTTGQAAEWRI